MKKLLLLAGLLVVAGSAFAADIQTEASGDVDIYAQVVTDLSIETEPLNFGVVGIKDTKIVSQGDTGAGSFTIKGASNTSGLTRFEWEKEIPVNEAAALLKLCEKGIIDKIRFEVKMGNHVFEIDEFYGDNEGLVMAEIELKSETETFEKPSWLGKEVTSDNRYYNSYLSKNPYKNW